MASAALNERRVVTVLLMLARIVMVVISTAVLVLAKGLMVVL